MKTPKTNQDYRLISQRNILNSARRLFVRDGYRNASVDEIAAESGLTKGAVYYYFKSKGQILLTLLDEIREAAVEQAVERLPAEGTAAARLVRFVNFHAGWAKRAPDELMLLILMSVEFASSKSAIRDRVEAIYSEFATALEEIVEYGKRRGEFDAALSARDATLMFLALHDGSMLQWLRGRREAALGVTLTRAQRRAFTRIAGAQVLAEVPAESTVPPSPAAARRTPATPKAVTSRKNASVEREAPARKRRTPRAISR